MMNCPYMEIYFICDSAEQAAKKCKNDCFADLIKINKTLQSYGIKSYSVNFNFANKGG